MIAPALIIGGAALIARGMTGGTPVAILTGTLLAALGLLLASLETLL